MSLRLAITADLHWDPRSAGSGATLVLRDFLRAHPVDVLLIAGDIGPDWRFGECLAQFAELPCRKALVPGNHDVWVSEDDGRGDSLLVYQEWLPQQCAQHGFVYLDHEPLLFPEEDLAIVGSINWYDYSWAFDRLKQQYPGELWRLQAKRFQVGRHNDGRFVRWPLDDGRFTELVVDQLEAQLSTVLQQVSRALVVTHHPPLPGLNFLREEPVGLDGLLWEAFSGNRRLESLLKRHLERIPLLFCGHTHQARDFRQGKLQAFNVGSDYPFKRLLLLDWPTNQVTTHTFHHPDAEV